MINFTVAKSIVLKYSHHTNGMLISSDRAIRRNYIKDGFAYISESIPHIVCSYMSTIINESR